MLLCTIHEYHVLYTLKSAIIILYYLLQTRNRSDIHVYVYLYITNEQMNNLTWCSVFALLVFQYIYTYISIQKYKHIYRERDIRIYISFWGMNSAQAGLAQ